MWYNPLVNWLLRSPLRRLMDGGTLLLTYIGRKSGRSFTFPIGYAQNGHSLHLITRPQKTWWKNLGTGAPVTLWLRGEKRTGQAAVVPLARDARLDAMFNVYRGMPRRLAEQQVDNAIVIAIQLDEAKDRPNVN
jgi:hypothetical protein